MRKLLDSILTLGLRASDTKATEYELRSVNFFTLVMSTVGCIYTPLFYALHIPIFAVMAPIATAIYVPAFWLQWRGHRKAARIWSLWAFNLSMGTFAVISGSALNIQLGFIISISVCFMFYSDWREATKQAVLNMLCYSLVAIAQMVVPPTISGTQNYDEISGFLITVTIMTIVISVFGFFVRRVSILEGRLHDLVRKRETLISLISHDIRNPLTVATSNLRALRSGKFDHDTAKQSDMMKKSEDHLNFIHQLLNNAQALLAAQTGKSSLNLTPMDLQAVASKLHALFEHQMNAKDVSIAIDDKTTEGTKILADENLVVFSVFGNLLSNAIKFSPRGGKITITLAKTNTLVLFEIQDQGIGVPADLLPILFESDKATTRRGTEDEKGTGFGLPLAKEMMRLHGGTIAAFSPANPGSERPGTIFRVEFPAWEGRPKNENSLLKKAG